MGSTQEASCKKDVEKAVSFCPNHPTCLSALSLIADTHARICLEQKEPGVNLKLLLPVVPHIIMASVSVLGISRLMPASVKLAR